MTYTSNTFKEGALGIVSPIYFYLHSGVAITTKIYITNAQRKGLINVPLGKEMRCKIKQLRLIETDAVIENHLISFTVKTNQSFTDALKTT